MIVRKRRNLDKYSTEFCINELWTEHDAQFAIIVNATEKGNKPTHNALTELIEEVKEQSKLIIEINYKHNQHDSIEFKSYRKNKISNSKTRKTNAFKQS